MLTVARAAQSDLDLAALLTAFYLLAPVAFFAGATMYSFHQVN